MNAKVTWKKRMTFEGTADTGFTVPLGSKPEVGGDNDGFRPMELIAIGLGGCTAMDVISILQKKRQEVSEFEVIVKAERVDEHPRIFSKILIEYHIKGKNIDQKAVERAVQLSSDRYCPAQAIIRKTAEIEDKIIITQE